MKHAAHAASDPMISDAELLLSIRIGLRSVYKDVLRQPVPRTIEALLMRLEADETVSNPSTVLASPSPAGGRPGRGNRH
jgi:hypothetical protein